MNFVIFSLFLSLSLVLRLGCEEYAFCVHRVCQCGKPYVAYDVQFDVTMDFGYILFIL